MIYVLAYVLSALVFLCFVLPLVRNKKGTLSHAQSAKDMLYDQLDEVSREEARGLISSDDVEAVQIEIKRQLIAIDQRNAPSSRTQNSGAWALVVAGLVVPLAAFGIYYSIGSPDMPSAIFSQRADERLIARAQIDQVEQLVVALNADPAGGTVAGWTKAAGFYLEAEKYTEAAAAYNRILNRSDATFDTFVRYAEALILSERGVVTPPALRALEQSLQMSPDNIGALFYMSFALEQAGDVEAAYSLLVSKLLEAQGNFPWMEAFVARANHYGRKLGQPQIALADFTGERAAPMDESMAAVANMTEEEQTAFIASMVEGLAERLSDDPTDLDGWLRLARAYSVLGEQQKERDAYQHAASLLSTLPDSDTRKAFVLDKIDTLQ